MQAQPFLLSLSCPLLMLGEPGQTSFLVDMLGWCNGDLVHLIQGLCPPYCHSTTAATLIFLDET